jgi:diaminohydroxyphosphoribosylaminopyrimidine deaminase / 5-amino-6-(5-phosphoribosylamino)uracil reductase
VAVGIGTVVADDPMLTARDLPAPAQRQPVRLVFDSSARLPLDSKLVGSVAEAPVVVVARPEAQAGRVAALREAGVEVLGIGGSPTERVTGALVELGRREVSSILLEGGAGLAGSFLDAGEVDELRLFVAPLVLGGAGAQPVAAGQGARVIADARRALSMQWESSGDDLLIRARLREW